jgi:hypothetical protein
VPGSFGCGCSVLATIPTFAPSRAARSAIAFPMPRDAPVMNSVLPERLIAPPIGLLFQPKLREIRLPLFEERRERLFRLGRAERRAKLFGLLFERRLNDH